jgi:hypothetical protein
MKKVSTAVVKETSNLGTEADDRVGLGRSVQREDGTEVDNQVAAPAETRTPNWHRANQHRSSRVRMEGWRQWWRLGGRKTLSNEETKEPS